MPKREIMSERVCPVWVGYLLASPLRKFAHNPDKILSPYVKEGMTVLDIGSAMGFFSIPMAQMVGPEGKVICVDMQEKMLERLQKRAHKAGVADRIETRLWEEGLTLGPVASRDLSREKTEKKQQLDRLVEEWAELSELESREAPTERS